MAGSKSDFLENELLDHVLRNSSYTPPATVYAALFTALPSDSGGGTEVTGGSYARTAITFGAASSGSCSNSAQVSFPAATASWGACVGFGIFDASTSGNLLYWGELLGTRKVFTVVPGTDVFTSTSHGYADTTEVQVEVTDGTLCAGISDNTTYFIRDQTTHTFKLAATSGGSAIDITTAGDGTLQIFANFKKTVASGDTAKFAIGQLIVTED